MADEALGEGVGPAVGGAPAGGAGGPAAAAAAAGVMALVVEGKVILCGESNCGKTTIASVFAKGETPNPPPKPSIGASYSKQTVSLPGCTVHMSVWDTAGTERFRSVNTLYYRGCVVDRGSHARDLGSARPLRGRLRQRDGAAG